MRQGTCPHLQCPQTIVTVKNHAARRYHSGLQGADFSFQNCCSGARRRGSAGSCVLKLCPGHLPRPTLLPAPLPQKRATRGTHLALNPRPATFRCGGQQATPPLRAALPDPSLAAENVRVERSTSGAGQSPKPRFALSPPGWGLGEDAEGLLPPAGPARKESVDANSHGTGQPPKSLVCSKPLGGAVAEGANAWSRVRAGSAGHSRASAAQVPWAGVGVARESRQRLQQERFHLSCKRPASCQDSAGDPGCFHPVALPGPVLLFPLLLHAN